MQPKPRPKSLIANLPSGVGVGKVSFHGSEYFRVRLGKKFTGGGIQTKNFKELSEARDWIFGDAQKETSSSPIVLLKAEAGSSAFNLSAGQIAEASSVFKKLSAAGLGLTEAVTYAIRHLRPAGGSVTLEDAVKKVLKLKELEGVSKKHSKGMKSIFGKIEEDLGKEKLSTFTREVLEGWLSDQDDVSASTKASYARHIHILFAEGVDRNWCAVNPAQKLTRSSSHESDIAIWTAVQMRQFLTAVQKNEPQLLLGVAIKAFAGVRTSELLRLEWSQIGDSKIQVLAKNAKTRRSRGIEIQPVLAAWIKHCSKNKKERQGLVVGLSENGWHDALQRACVAGGITMPSNILRHSFGTYRYYRTMSEAVVAYEMGNSPAVILKHYRAVAVKDLDVTNWWNLYPKGQAPTQKGRPRSKTQ